MNERILTRHPQGKQGVNISRSKYETVRKAIVQTLHFNGAMTFTQLVREVESNLADSFDGSIPWYTTTVKLDLEARQVIERVPRSRPQLLRLISKDKG